MPKFLEQELKKEYGNNPHAIYGTMNKIGAMRGNKETKKGERMEEKHKKKIEKDIRSMDRPSNIYHGQSVSLNRNYDKNHGTDKTSKGKSIYRHDKKLKGRSISKVLDKNK